VLNFSIAYGKTAHGLAKDFGTNLQEATETVERWYADRFEVHARLNLSVSLSQSAQSLDVDGEAAYPIPCYLSSLLTMLIISTASPRRLSLVSVLLRGPLLLVVP
jgi:hypothetical protein